MAKLENLKTGYSYNDLLLLPQYSKIKSRSEINLFSYLLPKQEKILEIPIICAPMDSLCEADMALALQKIGACGIIHRFNSIEQQVKIYQKIINLVMEDEKCDELTAWEKVKKMQIPAAIGVKDYFARIEALWPYTNIFLIDVAHGHHENVFDTIQEIEKYRSYKPKISLIAGNICTFEAAVDLYRAGVRSFRIGLGNGSLCSTRLVTGHGMPQASALDEIHHGFINWHRRNDVTLIADGGIKNSGDACKAFALGADSVMIGSLLAGADECSLPGVYRGMASNEAMRSRGDIDLAKHAAEGIAIKVSPKGPVVNIINDLANGLKSGFSYSGARNIRELWQKAIFIKQSSLSYHGESKPHGADWIK